MLPKNYFTIVSKLASMASELDAEWMLIGGVTVAAWGDPRSTDDVDFTLSVGTQLAPEVDKIMESFGFRKIEGAREIQGSGLYLSQYWDGEAGTEDTDAGVGIDVFYTETEWQQEAMNRRRDAIIGSKKYWIATPEDLLIYKVLAFREKDLLDLAGIIRQQYKKLDWKYVYRWASELGLAANLEDYITQYMEEHHISGRLPWES